MLFSGHEQRHDARKLWESGVGGDSLFQAKINCQVEQEAQSLLKVGEAPAGTYAVQEYWFETKMSALKQNISEGSALEEQTKSGMIDIGLDWEDRSSTEKKHIV